MRVDFAFFLLYGMLFVFLFGLGAGYILRELQFVCEPCPPPEQQEVMLAQDDEAWLDDVTQLL